MTTATATRYPRRTVTVVPAPAAPQDRERLLESFEISIEAAGLSPATLRLYRHGITKLYGWLTDVGLDAPLSGISAEHLREFLNAERRAGAAPASLESYHKAIRRFWRFLIEEGEVTDNPAARVPAPKVPELVVEALTPEQVAALLKVCRRDTTTLGRRDEAAIAALLDTGLRAGELLALTVEDIDRRERRAVVMGKGARQRVIGFEPRTLQRLDRYWRRAGITTGPALRSRTGARLSKDALYLMVRRRGEEASIEGLHPHVLRHTCATRLLEARMQESDVRTLMGWSRGSRMLERYTASRAADRALEARAGVRLA